MIQNDAVNDLGEMQANGQENPDNKMEELLNEEGLTIDFPKHGETRDGVIASISEGQILVSVGAKSEGLITGKEYEAIPPDMLSTLSVGKSIPVFVVTPEDQSGNLILSFVRAIEEQSWVDAEELLSSNTSFSSTIVGYNKGGLLVPLSTIRGFIPASQVSFSRRVAITGDTPEEKYKEMVGDKVEVRIIEVDRERRRLILSERAASSETRDEIKDKVIDDLSEGDIRVGKVTSLADFGAFVSINGADGLVHLSEISWDRVNNPKEILTIGQEVKVKIISIDKERRRIGLSIRQLKDDPWSDQIAALKIGQLVESEITRLTNFGAFARLHLEEIEKELEGLIHISEISEHRIEHPKEVIHVGDIVTLRIIKIEEDTHRIGLSMRRVDSPAYADLDWQSLTKEMSSDTPKGEGEDIAAFVPKEGATEEGTEVAEPETQSVEEVAVDKVEEVPQKSKTKKKPKKDKVVEQADETVEEVEPKQEKVVEQADETVEEVEPEQEKVVEQAVETVEEVEPEQKESADQEDVLAEPKA